MTWRTLILAALSFTAGLLVGSGIHPILPARLRWDVSRMRHATWSFVRRHVVAIALFGFVMSIALGVAGYVVNQRTLNREHDQAACIDNYNQQLAVTLKARSDSVRHAILAPRRFFASLQTILSDPSLSPAEREAAIVELRHANEVAVAKYDRYVATLKAHPLPPLPHAACSDVK